jgi:hypothetical protein
MVIRKQLSTVEAYVQAIILSSITAVSHDVVPSVGLHTILFWKLKRISLL